MNMHNPASPGELLSGWIDDLSLTKTAFAQHIGISRVMLSRVVNGRSAIGYSLIGQQGFPAITVPAGFTTEVWDRVRDGNGTRLVGPVAAQIPVGVDFLARPFEVVGGFGWGGGGGLSGTRPPAESRVASAGRPTRRVAHGPPVGCHALDAPAADPGMVRRPCDHDLRPVFP